MNLKFPQDTFKYLLLTNFFIKRTVSFKCKLFKLRKSIIPFEETNAAKLIRERRPIHEHTDP